MYRIKQIAHIENDFETKFGLPRQSGLIESIQGTIVFEPEYANPDALRGLEEYSHLWLLWIFSENVRDAQKFQPTVRPPILGGNVRKGVFATRSPFRPNSIGMSVAKIEGIELHSDQGPLIRVSGTDLMNGTPIVDIKPYIPRWDSYPEAESSFAGAVKNSLLKIKWENGAFEYYQERLSGDSFETLIKLLEEDPRPAYQEDPERIYGFGYAGLEIKFKVANGQILVLRNTDLL